MTELHTISYSYPTSEMADKFKKPDGCFLLAANGVTKAFDFLSDAKLAAMQYGTSPSRWSVDHPDNNKASA
jgi:hypothetical protein